jgi:predicted  nucleic acid-binding Zn-ribbon protein
MNPELEHLIQLQRAESELRRLEGELAEVPRKKNALDKHLAGERQHLDTAKAAHEDCLKSRRRHEGELQDLEVKRSRYREQLMEVKTNKEYTAKLHEIEGVERQIAEREDQILEELERTDALTAELKQAEGAFAEAESRHRAEVEALESAETGLREETEKTRSERDHIAAELPGQTLGLFRRVAKLRGGVAVCEARDGMCQLCHVVLRPQLFLDIKHNDQIFQCQSCSRILYFEPAPPVVAPPRA